MDAGNELRWITPKIIKSPRRDLNSRPLVYKTSALTTELRRREIMELTTHDNTKTLIHEYMAFLMFHYLWIRPGLVFTFYLDALSRVAQRKRAGPITQRSVDRNHPLLHTDFEEAGTRKEIWGSRQLDFQWLKMGPVRESNPGPRAPEARIIPLDQQAMAYIT